MADQYAQDFKKVTIEDIFGYYSFSKGAQEKYLPSFVFKAIQTSVENHETPSREVVEGFAAGLLRWALERGATHFTHWFVPINGRSAQKHDSFIKVIGDRAISAFSGETLSMGEPDGSSFPSGGLRATHEARGYTIWDPSSPPFIINHRTGATLYIPTVFCSWKGHPLDEKLPLKMASEALSEQALRLLTAAGDESHNYVVTNSGVEQEFFLVDSDYFLQRPDLMQTGRTLVGASAAKGQQLEDHYFGDLTERTMRLINDAERELWKLGIPQTTRHKEVAPGQYEMAPVFRPSAIASDNNIITMEVISRVAHHYGMEAIFHEKPFKGLNGSGKHNNWSIGTDQIPTVFTPGPNPQSNRIFMIFLAATLRGVDLHADLLRVAIASSANDHRLGAAEAPPAIISVYLGEEVNGAMEAFINKSKKPIQITPCLSKTWDVGIARGLPEVERHATDRNRTSPFAFTGNKFEFRAVGGSQTPHRSNYIINTIVADGCSFMADEIERRSQGKTKEERGLIAEEVAREVLIKHKRVVFNGNAYSEEWHKEAAERGLPNLKTTPDALETLVAPKNIELFRRLGVFKEETLRARQAAWLEEYILKITIEANSFLDIINTRIHPAVSRWINEFSETVSKATAATGKAPETLKARLIKLVELSDKLLAGTEEINERKEAIHHLPELLDQARKARELVGVLDQVRGHADALERLTPVDKWPLPSYAMMLFAGQTQNLNRFVKD